MKSIANYVRWLRKLQFLLTFHEILFFLAFPIEFQVNRYIDYTGH